YVPVRGKFKVFVIDEVHMLSKPAFNSMLKTLEEPPAHLKFILATTDPQKILPEEKIAYDPEALSLIARAASGSMRDALSLLDQAIAHGEGRLEAGGV